MKRYSIILFFLLISGIGFPTWGQKHIEIAKHITKVTLGGVYSEKKQVFENNTKLFLDAINKAYTTKNHPSISSSIADGNVNIKVGNLWASSPFLSARPNIIENLLSTSQGNYEVRNLQIIFEEAQKGYEQQDGVLLFDKSGKIIDFKIALGYHSTNSILRDPVSVTDLRRRNMIINFVEDFRTSYNLKDTAFLNKVFSNKALIITGKVLQKIKEGELEPKVQYTIQTKEQYLTRLYNIFRQVKMININFNEINVIQHPKYQQLYGVRLIQDWNTESIGGKYHDTGYVFLVIDFSVEENPKIWVRTWALEDFFSLDSFVFRL